MSNKDKIHALSRAVIIDQHHILLCKTLDLSINFYFLPGGHIEHGESAHNAVLRELLEECGIECKIKKFLGILEYSFVPGHSSICHNHEYNFFFEVESDYLKFGDEIKTLEDHIEILWVPLVKINEIDFRPEPLRKLIPEWLGYDMSAAFKSEMI